MSPNSTSAQRSRDFSRQASKSRQSKSNESYDRSELDSEVRVLGGSPDGSCSSASNHTSGFDDRESSTNLPSQYDLDPRNQYQSKSHISGESALLLIEDPDRTQYTGSASNASFLLCVRDLLVFKSSESTKDAHLLTSKEYQESTSPEKAEMADISQALEKFPPKDIADFLVHNFFYYAETTFYYCDREGFKESLANIYSGDPLSNEIDGSFVCLALLIFAMGSQFSHLGSEAKSDVELFTMISDPGARFYKAAQTLMPTIIAKCSLRGIQVCLLASLYNLPSNVPDTAYLYIGMAMRMAIASGLHRKTSGSSLDPRLVEVRNRLWWTIYCIERRISIALGRPTSIREEEMDAPYPMPYAPLDELESESNIQHQIEHIKLTKIVNQLIDSLPLESKPYCVADLKRKLKEWRSELLTNLHPSDTDPNAKTFRATIHLQIHYHYASLRMGRASLLQLVRDRLRRSFRNDNAEVELPQTAVDLAQSCVEAAKETIQHIMVLKKHKNLCRFSFSDYHGCSSALVILLLNSILERDQTDSPTLDNAIDLLRFMSTGGCGGAKFDMQTVEQFRTLINNLRQQVYPEEPPAPKNPKSSAYEKWVNWLSEGELGKGSGFVGRASTQATRAAEATSSTDPTSGLDSLFSPEVYQPGHRDTPVGEAYYSEAPAMVDSSSAGDFRMFDLDVYGLGKLDLTQLFNGYNHNSFP